MCFSAPASFIAGAALGVTSVFTLKKANHPGELPLAGIPLLFGLQQTAEGFVWLGLQDVNYAGWQMPFGYAFLFFAQVVWPTWVPLSLLLIERKKKTKYILYGLLACGIISSTFLALRLTQGNLVTDCRGMHISYRFTDYDMGITIISALYFLAIGVSPFVSSYRRMWIVGTMVTLSFLTTQFFYNEYLISVWCFFAAIISVSLYAIIPARKTVIILEPKRKIKNAHV